MTPLVSQLWPQFMADPDFAACFGRVVVEHAQMLRQERQVIFTLRSSAPLDKGLCARLLASLAPDYEGFELRIHNLFGYATLDEASLRKIADETKGTYFRAKDTSSLVRIYDAIDKLEPGLNENQFVQETRELYYLPLLAALLLAAVVVFQTRRAA